MNSSAETDQESEEAGGGGTSGSEGGTKRRRLARRWADVQESAALRVLCAQSCQRSLGQIVEEVVASDSEEEGGEGTTAEAQRGVTERWFGRG